MKIYVEKYKFRFIDKDNEIYYGLVDGFKYISIEDIARIINDREIAQYFFKNFPDLESFPFVYLMNSREIAERALEFLEPYLIMKELTKWVYMLLKIFIIMVFIQF